MANGNYRDYRDIQGFYRYSVIQYILPIMEETQMETEVIRGFIGLRVK